MAQYSTNQFKPGLKILLDQAPCSIINNEFVKPGKGQAFNRVTYRNLKTGRVLEKTFKSGESVEAADVMETDLSFSYQNGDEWVFMDDESYEQYTLSAEQVESVKGWLQEGIVCTVTFWNEQALLVEPPTFVELLITTCEPGVKGNTVSGANKRAVLETGVEVKVPLFIEQGERIRIDTRNGEYVGRVKDGND